MSIQHVNFFISLPISAFVKYFSLLFLQRLQSLRMSLPFFIRQVAEGLDDLNFFRIIWAQIRAEQVVLPFGKIPVGWSSSRIDTLPHAYGIP